MKKIKEIPQNIGIKVPDLITPHIVEHNQTVSTCRLSMIIRGSVVLNRTVVVDSG